jgi:hypothetical protein
MSISVGTIFYISSITLGNAANGWILRAWGGKCEIIEITSGKVVVIEELTETIPNDPNNTLPSLAPGTWSVAPGVSSVSGLNHLEGMEVAILADGSVGPNQTVVNGSVTLPYPASKVTIGLPYTCQAQTLYLEHPDNSGGTAQTKIKNIDHVGIRVQGTRGLQVGANQTDTSTLQGPQTYPTWTNMSEIKERNNSILAGSSVPLFTGDYPFKSIMSGWNEKGQIAVQQIYPLPANILAVVSYWNSGDDK